jgi:hypothetical protein
LSYRNQRLVIDCEQPFPLGVDDPCLRCAGSGGKPGEHGFELLRLGAAVPLIEEFGHLDQVGRLAPCGELAEDPRGEVKSSGSYGLDIDVALGSVKK